MTYVISFKINLRPSNLSIPTLASDMQKNLTYFPMVVKFKTAYKI